MEKKKPNTTGTPTNLQISKADYELLLNDGMQFVATQSMEDTAGNYHFVGSDLDVSTIEATLPRLRKENPADDWGHDWDVEAQEVSDADWGADAPTSYD